jgi:hypothetical protein
MEHEKMTPERFRQVRNLFEAALEKQPAEREEFVDEAAQSDQDLRAEVERMLDAHQRTVTFLDGSVAAPTELRTDPRRMEGRRAARSFSASSRNVRFSLPSNTRTSRESTMAVQPKKAGPTSSWSTWKASRSTNGARSGSSM